MQFEKGRWYKWVGPKIRQKGWNYDGQMDFILNGKPWKCKEGGLGSASFEGQPYSEYRKWTWFRAEGNIIEINPIDKNKNYMLEFN